MISDGCGIARALAGVAIGVCLTITAHGRAQQPLQHRSPQSQPVSEVRALWVLRSSVASAESIAALVRSAKRHGFNTLFVQVRGRGDAYYLGGPEPRAAELTRQPPAFDPLAQVLETAHAEGLRVHAWVNVNLVSSAADLPKSRSHIIYRHPESLMVPRELARELSRLDHTTPAYVARLARWTRGQKAGVEGLYISPISRPAVDHLTAVVRHLTRRYAVDGVHFDYARYPNDTFDYSRLALREFRASVRSTIPAARRRALAAREGKDLFAFPDALPDEWRRFRAARMTDVMARLRNVVKSERPAATVSVAAAADIKEAAEHRFQEWPHWLTAGLIDAVCPMAYTSDRGKFAEQITAAVAAAGDRAVWAGIGAYRLSPEQTIANIATARRLGAGGVVLFSYDSLVDPRNAAGNYLGEVARAVFGRRAADGGSR
jgi:uncharacterized lipoprotein YddW (UPF0748 family)